MASPLVSTAIQHLQAGQAARALALLDEALKANRGDVAAWFYRAKACESLGRLEDALAAYRAVLGLSRDEPAALAGCAFCLSGLGRQAEALAAYDAVLKQLPDQLDIAFNRADCLGRLGRHAEALAAYDRYLLARPADHEARIQRAVALFELDRLEEALEDVNRAGALPEAIANRALILLALGRPAEAWTAFDQALAAAPGAADARRASLRYHRGMSALYAGDFRRGWPDYESRWAAGLVDPPALDRGEPAWTGERVGTLRVWREQPIGDELILSRLLAAAAARVDRLILECSPRMVPLFTRSFPGLIVRPQGQVNVAADAQVSIASLGAVMGLDADALDGGAPWLLADPDRTRALRARYAARAGGRPIIGISWFSKNPVLGGQKSAPLDQWEPLLRQDVLFVNLQYGPAAAEAGAVAARFGCEIVTDPEIDQLADLDAFAAQVAAMDRVVSVSNTTVHFAGALGVPCRVLLSPGRGSLWYWGAEGDTTPWYAAVTVSRRARGEGWTAQIEAAARAGSALTASR